MILNNSQYESIMHEYDSRKFQSKYNLDRRKDAIYSNYPGLKALNDRIAEISVRSAKLALMGDEHALDTLQDELDGIAMQKKSQLVSYGYPEDYLEPRYVCPDCKDTGFIENERCHCFDKEISKLLYKESNLSGIIEQQNFSKFRMDIFSDEEKDIDTLLGCTPYQNMVKIVGTTHSFIDNFDKNHGNLLIYGNTGTGKTFLAGCIAAELLNSGHTVQYLTAYKFYEILENHKFRYNEYMEFNSGQLEYIMNCELLIIDDLGSELSNSFTASQLYAVINERQVNGYSTIITTNLSIQQLEDRYSERVFSRLSGYYTFLKVIGRDLRLM